MSQLDNAFKAFKINPTAENAWKLQQEMVAYAVVPVAASKPKESRKSVQLKTKKGAKWDAKLKEILDLFAAFDWEVTPWKSNQYLEAWKVTDSDLNQAVLYLNLEY